VITRRLWRGTLRRVALECAVGSEVKARFGKLPIAKAGVAIGALLFRDLGVFRFGHCGLREYSQPTGEDYNGSGETALYCAHDHYSGSTRNSTDRHARTARDVRYRYA